jgi:membrane-associated phospholipid phosphatase
MRIYDAISLAAYPPVLDVFITLVFAFYSPIGLGMLSPVSVILISLIFVTLIPLIPVPYHVKRGRVDMYVSNRKQRTNFYLIAIVSYLAAVSIFLSFKTMVMFYLTLSFLLIALAVMLVNLRWKISAHAAGIAGPITAVIYVFGWQYIVLHIFTVVVVWARLKLDAHSFMQILAGCAVSAGLTLAVFCLFTPFGFV